MPEESRGIRLGELAHTRSGDKGDRSNIGVVARDAAAYARLETHLTEAAVAEFLRPLGIGAVRRYELPRLHAFNFVIEHALAGGASRSLRLDSQGKALGVILLELRLPASPRGTIDRPSPGGLAAMGAPVLNRDDRGPIAVLTLNRPERRNALSRELLVQLRDAVEEAGVDVAIRAVVLTGAGPTFCAGMDLKEAAECDAAPDGEHAIVEVLKEFADLLQCIHTLPKPTIAAVNGDALAGGAGVMSACDLAIAAETARIGYPEVRRGLVPAIVMHDLTRQLGDRRARQLLLSGEPISSRLACDWGLVNAVTPADRCLDEAIRIAQSFVECGPSALATTKRLLDETVGRPKNLRGAAAISAVVRASEEAVEGIRAFVEKRPPSWTTSPHQARVAVREANRAAEPGREEPTIKTDEL